jgi:hypothetical protein
MDSAQRWEVGEKHNTVLRHVILVFNCVIITIYNKQQLHFYTGFLWNSEAISRDIFIINTRRYPATGVKQEPLKFGICSSSFFLNREVQHSVSEIELTSAFR